MGSGSRTTAIAVAAMLLVGCSALVPPPEVPPSFAAWVAGVGAVFKPIAVPPGGMLSAAEAEAMARREILKGTRPRFRPEAPPLLIPGRASPPVFGTVTCTQAPTCPRLWGTTPEMVEGVKSAAIWVVDFPNDDFFVVIEAQEGLDFTIFG